MWILDSPALWLSKQWDEFDALNEWADKEKHDHKLGYLERDRRAQETYKTFIGINCVGILPRLAGMRIKQPGVK